MTPPVRCAPEAEGLQLVGSASCVLSWAPRGAPCTPGLRPSVDLGGRRAEAWPESPRSVCVHGMLSVFSPIEMRVFAC